jgi:hypothetical protein
LADAEAIVHGALIEVRSMGLQNRLAACEPAQQRDGRVGEIIERQQQSHREMAAAGEHDKQPAQQQADR